MHAAEKCTILENAATGNELAEAAKVCVASLREHLEDCFCLRREIKSILGLAIIDPLQSKAVVEQRCGAAPAVSDQAVEPAVQILGETGILLVLMHKIRGTFQFTSVAPLLQAPGFLQLRIFLAGKDKNDVFALISDRHTITEGILTRGPPNVDSRRLIAPCSRCVERFVLKDLQHPEQLLLCPLARPCSQESDNPGHTSVLESSVVFLNLRLYKAFRNSLSFATNGSGKRSMSLCCRPKSSPSRPKGVNGT